MALALAGPVILLAGAVAAIARRDDGALRLSTVLAIATLGVTSVPFIALSRSCSDRDQEAWRAWIEGRRRGAEPADCGRY